LTAIIMLSMLLNSEDTGLPRCSALTGPRCAQIHSQCIVLLVILWWCVQLYMWASCNNDYISSHRAKIIHSPAWFGPRAFSLTHIF